MKSVVKRSSPEKDTKQPRKKAKLSSSVKSPSPEKDATKKRKREEEKEEKGKQIVSVGPPRPTVDVGPPKPPAKKKRTLKFEKIYLERLPSANMYEKSYMHRDIVTHCAVSAKEFFITASRDGHVKFWKKQPEGVEFVKHFRAHLAAVTSLSVSHDGTLMCTSSEDGTLKIFDVLSFDMINMFNLPYQPGVCEWIFQKATGRHAVACAETRTGRIHLYNLNCKMEEGHPVPVAQISLHSKPVTLIKYNYTYETVVSVDSSGMIEYWSPSPDYGFPDNPHISFQYKSDTDLYEFMKKKAVPVSLEFSPNGKLFATMGNDRYVRIFNFLSGKLYRVYKETLSVFNEIQKDPDAVHKIDAIDFGRRMAVERQINQDDNVAPSNVVFDYSSNFVLYSTMLGIKVVNILTNQIVRIIGIVESTERFLSIALYQGKNIGSVEVGDLKSDAEDDPTLLCTAYKKHRLYLFSKREPEEPDEDLLHSGRDVFNERPPKEEQAIATKTKATGQFATIHTTLGDIHLTLFPNEYLFIYL